jgi:hypothetical protein
MPSTPHIPEPFLARFSRSETPKFGAKKPDPLPRPAGGVVIFGTLQGATGGTQTHSRRTGSKLGRLHRARQGLVRVPESNTKYGGKGEKTGVTQRPLFTQVSVSPQGFPSKKNRFPRPWPGFAPLFTGQLFFVHLLSTGTCVAETQGQASDMSGLACPPTDGQGRR